MPTKALEIDLRILMSSPHADGGMAELVEIPARCILLPEGIRLTVGKAGITIGREIGPPGEPSLAVGDKQRPGARRSTGAQVGIEQRADGTGEKHLAWTTALAVNDDRA